MTGGTTTGSIAITMSGTVRKIVRTAFTWVSVTGTIGNSQEWVAIGRRNTSGGAMSTRIPHFSRLKFDRGESESLLPEQFGVRPAYVVCVHVGGIAGLPVQEAFPGDAANSAGEQAGGGHNMDASINQAAKRRKVGRNKFHFALGQLLQPVLKSDDHLGL